MKSKAYRPRGANAKSPAQCPLFGEASRRVTEPAAAPSLSAAAQNLLAYLKTRGAVNQPAVELAPIIGVGAELVGKTRRELVRAGLATVARPAGLAPVLRLAAWRCLRAGTLDEHESDVRTVLTCIENDLSLLIQARVELADDEGAERVAGTLEDVRRAMQSLFPAEVSAFE